jgi:HAD superfamily hydrolase (TIGR01549 family)
MKLTGIIWDYDGTLVDSRMKNFNVTKAILSEITSDLDKEYSALESLESYEKANIKSSNWRELYRNEFGLDEKQIDEAGRLWTKFQLLDKTDVELVEGIGFTVSQLGTYPQGIVSQNSSENIKRNLKRFSLEKYFGHIIGYEEVDFVKQKPNPEGLLTCISEIVDLESKDSVIYIGDHITDIQCAYHANDKMGRNAVISILLNHNKHDLTQAWDNKPDYIAGHPRDILDIIGNIVTA